MKSLLILVVIGVFGLRIFAEDSNISLRIANDHNRNISRDLKLKIIKLMNDEIVKNSTYAQTQTLFAKAKEEALNDFNSTKIGAGAELVDQYYNSLKRDLDAVNRAYFRSIALFHKAIVYYKNYIEILMIVIDPKGAHEETKSRAIATFTEEARSGNKLFDAFKQKLEKELDLQFQWTFPDIDTVGWFQSKFRGAAGGSGTSSNHNSNATLGNSTDANNTTEATTQSEINQTKTD